MTRSRHCGSGFRPRQALDAKPRDAFGQHVRSFVAWDNRHRLLGDAMAPSRRSRRVRRLGRRWIEGDFVARYDAVGKARLDFAGRDRRGEQDAAGGGASGKLGHGEVGLARKRRGRIDLRAAAISEHEMRPPRCRGSWRCARDRRARAARRPSAASGALSIDLFLLAVRGSVSAAHRLFAISAQRCAMARASRARGDRSRRRASSRSVRSMSSPASPRSPISTAISAAASAAPSAAASTTMRASRGGSGKSRSFRPSSLMRPSASMAPSVAEQSLRFGQCRARRRIEEGELFRTAAPCRQIERKGRQIGGQDFRPRKRFKRSGLRFVPEPIADAWLDAAGAAAPLVGRGARGAHRFEPRHSDIGLVARHTRQARSR